MRAIARRWRAGSCLILAVAGTTFAGSRADDGCVERLKADVYYLTSVTLEGRGLSTPGVALTARHIRAEFRRIGLKGGAADGSYFQQFAKGGRTLINVIGVLEGAGELANQTVIVGAHYDHLGRGEGHSLAPEAERGRVHPGADDNASGTAVLLELARRFAAREAMPRRRLVFLAFSGEEAGLLGSRHYATEEPLFSIADTAAMVNLDMVGRVRDGELGVAGDESAAGFDDLLKSADAASPLRIRRGGPEYPDDSDHAPFAKAKIPILYFCTGQHEDRHTPSDTPDKINFEGMAKVADIAEDIIGRLLALPRPRFVPPPRRGT